VNEEVPPAREIEPRCACPPERPVWHKISRLCVQESYCGDSECGALAIPQLNEAVLAVKANTVCEGDRQEGTCGGCVEARNPVHVCWRLGGGVAEKAGKSKQVVIALYRQGGNCDDTSVSSHFGLINGTADRATVVLNNITTNTNGSVTVIDEKTIDIQAYTNFLGIPHLILKPEEFRSCGSASIDVNCTGVFEARLVLVDSVGVASNFGDCQVATQNAACPGEISCSGHGVCNQGFNDSTCDCEESYHGNDCSVQYITLPTGSATVLPGANGANFTTQIYVPPEAKISVEDNGTVVVTDDSRFTFLLNGTIVIENTNGTVLVINSVSLPASPFNHSCPGNQFWADCSAGCAPTCRNPTPRCFPTCLTGTCQCPHDKPLWDELQELCVEANQCSEQSPCPGIGAICGGRGECINSSCSCFQDWSGDDCSIFKDLSARVTTTSGSVQVVTPCQFPFKFRDRIYNDCTADFDSEGKEWCSVTYEWEQKWGYCAARGRCPVANGLECNGHGLCQNGACECQGQYSGIDCTITSIRYTNNTNQVCVFPFLGADMKDHNDCIPGIPIISDDQLIGTSSSLNGESYCLTSFRWNGISSFGYCQPVGSCGNCSSTGGLCDPSKSGICICKPGYTGVSCGTLMTEKDILLKLFADTNGYGWSHSFGWKSGAQPCASPSWAGISCRNNQVIRINLSGAGLTGSIPVALSALPALEVLDLSTNHLSGIFPTELLVSPVTLRSIVVSGNHLSGPLPQVSKSVVYSDFSDNYFNMPEQVWGCFFVCVFFCCFFLLL
jgi:hypothetical protein